MGVDTGPRRYIMGPMNDQTKECPICGGPYDPDGPEVEAATATTAAMVKMAEEWRKEQLDKVRRAFVLLEEAFGICIEEEREERIEENSEEPSETETSD